MNNFVYQNVFSSNLQYNAQDFGTDNNWSYEGKGNDWDDYDGEGPYSIFPNGLDEIPAGRSDTTSSTTDTTSTEIPADLSGIVLMFTVLVVLSAGAIGAFTILLENLE